MALSPLVSRAGLLAPWCCVGALALGAQEPPRPAPVLLPALPRPALWMNEPTAFQVQAPDALSITGGKATDLYTSLNGEISAANAPMLLFPADDTFVLTTKVTADFKLEFDGGFLVVYANPTHWIKFLFEKSHYGPYSVCSNVTKGDTDDSVNAEVPTKEVHLRLSREKDVFTLYHSVDGKAWAYIRTFRFAVKGPLKVGFGSQSPVGEQCRTTFSHIRYAAKTVADFWTGEPKP